MRLAILGTRGIPANYGGFETFAEELSRRLAARGHDVTVYCRNRHSEKSYEGVDLQYLPTFRHKYFDTVVHTFLSTLHLLTHRRRDAVLYCNAANAVFTWLPRIFGVPVALNVDGLERKRRKWNALGRAWYRLSEWLSTFFPTVVVSDAVSIKHYYRERYARESVFIPYGAELGKVETMDVLVDLGLEPDRYFLYVSRMEPENNALMVREAFERVNTDMKLALIGDAPYSHDYIRQVRNTSDPRIVIPGAIYGQGYRELTSHCFAYIHATEVGGTHPALIEAMGRGALTLYLKTEENDEVAAGAGVAFTDNLVECLNQVLTAPPDIVEQKRRDAAARIAANYSWTAVTDSYESLFRKLAHADSKT